jgi:pyruvate/2-oxoglutarate dehydrogenase complex dihydrolipoamide dehydrogenase (E3) component
MDYDVIVVGAGQAGAPLANACARAGKRTALIERAHVGGTCVNEGCTPTKTMVASARVAHLTARAADYGVRVPAPVIDMERVRQRKRDIVQSFRSGGERRLHDAGVDVIAGEARFTGERTLAVSENGGAERTLRAGQIYINVGCRPALPDTPGLNSVPWLDSTSIMELDTVPEHLLVIGGGYIGLEFGQMFRRFGARVTIVQRDKQLLSLEDPDIAEGVSNILREDGIDILLIAEAASFTSGADGDVRASLRVNGAATTIAATHLLIAAGRVPNTDALAPAAGGIDTDARGYIRVNERLETSARAVYALGDVKGGPAFTHISYDDYRILKTNLLEGGTATTTNRLVPYTVFIDPQLGRIGITETQARREGRSVRVARMPMNYVARALEMDESRGLIKAVVDCNSDRILGGAVLGIEGGEIMAALQVAMMGHLPFTALREGIFAHPTLAECFNNLFGYLED